MSPYIVCPGQWSQSDLEYHAGTVVAGMTHNAGHNCLKAEVLLLDRDWPQREAFLAALRSVSSGLSVVGCSLTHGWVKVLLVFTM